MAPQFFPCGPGALARDLYSPRYDRLRELITEARKQAGLTQKELGARINRPQSYVTDLERAERRIDVIEYIVLAEAIGFDAHDFLQRVMDVQN